MADLSFEGGGVGVKVIKRVTTKEDHRHDKAFLPTEGHIFFFLGGKTDLK